MTYYVDIDADEVAAELWANHGPEKGQEGTVSGTAASNHPQEAAKGSADDAAKPPSR